MLATAALLWLALACGGAEPRERPTATPSRAPPSPTRPAAAATPDHAASGPGELSSNVAFDPRATVAPERASNAVPGLPLIVVVHRPPGLVVPEGSYVQLAIDVVNTGSAPIEVGPSPLPVLLRGPGGELVRPTGKSGSRFTLSPGSHLWSGVGWDQRRDDGSPARPGRYSAELDGLVVRHAGGTSTVKLALEPVPLFVINPNGGVRGGVLPLGLAATDQGTTLTLDRLDLRFLEARLEAHVAEAPPSRALPGAPPAGWHLDAEYRLDGAPPIPLPPPDVGAQDPARTALTWHLDALPKRAREIDLTVRAAGTIARDWRIRIPLPAETPDPTPRPPPTPIGKKPPGGPPGRPPGG
jgi:hypothetical protein